MTTHTRNSSKELGEINDNSYSLYTKLLLKTGAIFWHLIDRTSCRSKMVSNWYHKTVGGSYKKESEEFNLGEGKNILHIGCGFYPITAITLAENDGVKVTTIDKNPKALEYAKKVVKKKKLDKKITISQGQGTKFPLDPFDIIIISGCSVPKIEVLNHVFNNAKSDSKIIVRESFLDIDSIINKFNNNNLKIVKRIMNYPFFSTSWESIYLLKK